MSKTDPIKAGDLSMEFRLYKLGLTNDQTLQNADEATIRAVHSTVGLADTRCECVACCDGEHAGCCMECAGWGSNNDEEVCSHCAGTGTCPVCDGKEGEAMTANVRSEPPPRLFAEVGSTDGLCGNGSEVGAGGTAT